MHELIRVLILVIALLFLIIWEKKDNENHLR